MRKYLLAVPLLLLALPILATAQFSGLGIKADIPFSFTVEGVQMPAGNYTFNYSPTMDSISIANRSGKQTVLSPVMSRLSPQSENEAEVTFGVVGKDHYLSEIYMPGMDGFQLPGAPAMHTHVKISGRK